MQNLDVIIRVRMVLRETSMLLFVFRIMFVLIRVSREIDRYGLARADKLIMPILPAQRNFMLLSIAELEVGRKLYMSSGI